jgi:photosystem II stability/assembly factor-like uncharacterized protein
MEEKMSGRVSMTCLVAIFATGLTGCVSQTPSPVAALPTVQPTGTGIAMSTREPIRTPTETESAGSWKVAFGSDAAIKYSVNVAGFENETHGIAVGYSGEVHYTLDGGKSWPRAENNSACLFGLDIVSDQTAWATGHFGKVRVSKDGGKTWQAVTDTDINISFLISFIDDATGWVGDETKLEATQDGGQSWTVLPKPADGKRIMAINLRTATEGYLLDSNSSLFATRDGGNSWALLSKLPKADGKMFVASGLPHAAIRFFDASNGLVIFALDDGDGQLLALRTADGGKTWSQEILPVTSGVLFLSRDGRFLTVLGKDLSIMLLKAKS